MAALLGFLVRAGVCVVFAWAGISKLQSPTGTLLGIYQYRLLSWEASAQAAALLPWVECLTALGLWIPRLRLGAGALGIALCLVFLGALGSAWARGLDIACGCFGSVDIDHLLLARMGEDLVLLGACIWLYRRALPAAPFPPDEKLPICNDPAN